MSFLRSAPGAEPVIVEGVFDAPVDRVFRAWVQPDEIRAWFGQPPDRVVTAEIDLRVGGRWRFWFDAPQGSSSRLEGEYLEIEPERRLVFTWRHVAEHPDGRREETPESRVSISFEPTGDGTRVSLRHEGILRAGGREGVGAGWNASFERLQTSLAETGGEKS